MFPLYSLSIVMERLASLGLRLAVIGVRLSFRFTFATKILSTAQIQSSNVTL